MSSSDIRPAAAGELDLSRVSVLIVDGDLSRRKLVRQLLAQKGITAILEAADGCDALEMLDGGTIPEAVLCRADLEIIGGVELAAVMQYHGNRLVNTIPVVLLVDSQPDAGLKQEARSAGVSRILVPPLSADNIAASIAEVAGFVPDWSQNDPI